MKTTTFTITEGIGRDYIGERYEEKYKDRQTDREKVKRSIRRMCEGYGISYDDASAEDAIQDGLLYLYEKEGRRKKLEQLAAEKGLEAWVLFCRIARHRYLDNIRKFSAKIDWTVDIMSTEQAQTASYVNNHSRDPANTLELCKLAILQEVELIPCRTWDIYDTAALLLEGLTQEEIAAKIGKTVRTVKRHVQAIRQALQDYDQV